MEFYTFIVFYSVITAAFGAGFILMPGQMYSIYGVTPDASLNLVGQLFGAALTSLGLLAWLIRDMKDSETRRTIVLALLVGEVMGLIVAINGQINTVLNLLGWSAVITYSLLSAGLAYFRFSEPDS